MYVCTYLRYAYLLNFYYLRRYTHVCMPTCTYSIEDEVRLHYFSSLCSTLPSVLLNFIAWKVIQCFFLPVIPISTLGHLMDGTILRIHIAQPMKSIFSNILRNTTKLIVNNRNKQVSQHKKSNNSNGDKINWSNPRI